MLFLSVRKSEHLRTFIHDKLYHNLSIFYKRLQITHVSIYENRMIHNILFIKNTLISFKTP